MNRFIVGLYQIITGIFGIVFLLISYFSKANIYGGNQLVTNQVITGVLLFVLLVWTGFGLIRSNRKARQLAILLQTIQIPIVYAGSYIYKFTSAGFLSLGYKNGEFAFQFKLKPIDFAISTNFGNESVYMLYLIPVLFLILLIKSK